mmetsp:Transcript_20457/g.30373  ORF Transcript_20457/g.30373 Transcript_20457/m.30373 type:complete len:138 (-) Transcript_20457:661-1074(-)
MAQLREEPGPWIMGQGIAQMALYVFDASRSGITLIAALKLINEILLAKVYICILLPSICLNFEYAALCSSILLSNVGRAAPVSIVRVARMKQLFSNLDSLLKIYTLESLLRNDKAWFCTTYLASVVLSIWYIDLKAP